MPKTNVVVCVTPQLNCVKQIEFGKYLAQHLGVGIKIVTIQPKLADAQKRADDLKILYKLSKKTSCSIDVLYSQNTSQGLYTYICKQNPCHIILGSPDNRAKFYTDFIAFNLPAPISIVNEKFIYTLPTMSLPLTE